MSLTKTALVVGLVVLLLPTDEGQQARLYQQVSGAAHWTVTFCDRNQTTCEQAQSFWATFRRKAEFGGKLAYDLIQSSLNERATANSRPLDGSPIQPSRNTLTPDDVKPTWRGQQGA